MDTVNKELKLESLDVESLRSLVLAQRTEIENLNLLVLTNAYTSASVQRS